jgi:hypothetical protein
MATTTPNYGWDVPTSTDYVKDGATAIETLGDDIDASLFSITGGKNVGLQHINTTTFTGVSSISLNNVFTTAYENYRIEMNAVGSANAGATFVMRKAGVNTTAGYNGAAFYTQFSGGAANFNSASSAANAPFPAFGSNGGSASFDVMNAATVSGQVVMQGLYHYPPASYCAFFGYNINGNTFDGFTITINSGTFTGTIRVYGYRN